jgi:hypothetical protein
VLYKLTTQEPAASANLDVRAIKNEPIGVLARGLGVHYVVSVKSVKFLLNKLINIRFCLLNKVKKFNTTYIFFYNISNVWDYLFV